MLKILRNGLSINSQFDMEYGQGSANTKVQLINDNSYQDYVVQMHCGFINQNNEEQNIILDKEGEYYILPKDVFINSSPLYLAVGLVKDEEIIKTEQLRFVVKKSPDGNVILPDIATWQELVSDYTQGILDLYTNNVLTPTLANTVSQVEGINQQVIESGTTAVANVNTAKDTAIQEVNSTKDTYINEMTTIKNDTETFKNQTEAIKTELEPKLNEIGNLEELPTEDKSSLVGSIIELFGNSNVELGESADKSVKYAKFESGLVIQYGVAILEVGATNKIVTLPITMVGSNDSNITIASNRYAASRQMYVSATTWSLNSTRIDIVGTGDTSTSIRKADFVTIGNWK